MKKYILLTIFFLCGFCLVLTGCVKLNNKYIVQQKYALAVILQKPVAHKNDKILEIYYPEIAAQFSGANFVYRTHELKYTSDYYNIFFVSPLEQIYHNELKYLQTVKLFKYVSGDVTPLKPNYILKTYVNALYADYCDAIQPKAVMAIQFVLLDVSVKPVKIIMQKTFSQSMLLPQKSSDALVATWNKELESILQQLIGLIQKTVSHRLHS